MACSSAGGFIKHIHDNISDGVNLREEREDNAPHRNTFIRNIFGNSSKTQKAAIYVYRTGLEPALAYNRFDLHACGELVFEKP